MRSQDLFGYGAREELGGGFWFYAEEGPDFWHGPWSGADWVPPTLIGLVLLAVVVCLALFLQRAGQPLRHLHALRGLSCLAIAVLSTLAGNWDHLFLGLPIFAALIFIPDLYFTCVKTHEDPALPQSDRGALGFLLSFHIVLFMLD
jgi:hypothetical protein